MKREIEQHFQKFYNRLLFLEQEIGKEERTYEKNIFITDYQDKDTNKCVSSFIYEEKENDEYIFLRKNGLVARLEYGAWYNKKYKELNLFINKDIYYNGDEKANVTTILNLVNDYIKNNYKEYYEKINKVIVGIDKTKDIKIKYRSNNILSMDNIKNIKIENAIITDEDIKSMAKYKNLRNVTFINCTISAHNFYLLKTWSINIYKSFIEDLTCFNSLNVSSFSIDSSKINKEVITPLTLNVNDLSISDTKLNLEIFFLTTNFKKLESLNINNQVLNPLEISFLKVFYEVKELSLDGKTYSFDFLDELPALEKFRGYIELINKDLILKYQKMYEQNFLKLEIEDKKEERFNSYIFYHTLSKMWKRNKFAKSILLSQIAMTKWLDKIKSATDEDVKNIYKLSVKERKNLGKENEIKFVETDFKDPFNILSNTEDRVLSSIIGISGERLVRQRDYGYVHERYILGPNGKVYESVEFTNEQDVKVPEYIAESKRIIAENKDNVFDYYYNRKISEEEKVQFLSLNCISYLYQLNDSCFIKNMEKNDDLLKRKQDLEQKIEKIKSENKFLLMSPRHQYIEEDSIFNGNKIRISKVVPDEFLIEDNTLYHALKRTRNIDVIRFSLEEIFKEEKISLEKQKDCYKQIYNLLNLWSLLEKLEKEIERKDEIVIKYFKNYYNEVVEDFEKENYFYWYLEDIDNFLSRYHLTKEAYLILTNYILMRQSRYRADLIFMLEKTEERMFILKEYYSIENTLIWSEEETGSKNPDEWLEKRKINQEEYKQILEYLELEKILSDLNLILDYNTKDRENIYEEMMPIIDNFSLEDLKQIKENIMAVNKKQDKFVKFTDFVYYYIYHKYPKWIELELKKCPRIPKKYSSEIKRELVKESTYHVDASLKINKHPYI